MGYGVGCRFRDFSLATRNDLGRRAFFKFRFHFHDARTVFLEIAAAPSGVVVGRDSMGFIVELA
jgi:hypothetical protein